MQIGTMNHPGHDVLLEIEMIGRMGFDFVDLTLEPPLASAANLDVRATKDALRSANLGVVGHTAYYLPLCSPFESIRRAVVEELKLCLEVFSVLGAGWMNLHPDRQAPLQDRRFVIDRNLQTLRELLVVAKKLDVGLMLENLPEGFNSPAELGELLDPLPELGLHLDIGHANLLTDQNTTDGLLARYTNRLKHVHLHDNKGGEADLHLPLGAGTLDYTRYVRLLQACGYDGTITLEVFTPDRHYLGYSRDILTQLWTGKLLPTPPPGRRKNGGS